MGLSLWESVGFTESNTANKRTARTRTVERQMPVEFVTIDRDIPYLSPSSVQDYLPEDHLARVEREQIEDEGKMAWRMAKQERTGKQPATRPPKAPSAEPGTEHQVSLTDEDSRIMLRGQQHQPLYPERPTGA